MTLEQKIAAISAIASIFSVIIAVWSLSVAKKAMSISEQELKAKLEPFSLYLNDGFRYRGQIDGKDFQILLFSISVTNSALVPNGITRIELQIECLSDDGRSVKYVIPHDPTLVKVIPRDITVFQPPLLFNPKESFSRWVTFSELPLIPKSARRDSYSIVITDSSGSIVKTNAVIIRDLTNDKK